MVNWKREKDSTEGQIENIASKLYIFMFELICLDIYLSRHESTAYFCGKEKKFYIPEQ
jgi:hypothetical protein